MSNHGMSTQEILVAGSGAGKHGLASEAHVALAAQVRAIVDATDVSGAEQAEQVLALASRATSSGHVKLNYRQEGTLGRIKEALAGHGN